MPQDEARDETFKATYDSQVDLWKQKSDQIGPFMAAAIPVSLTAILVPCFVIPTFVLRAVYFVPALALWWTFVVVGGTWGRKRQSRKRERAGQPNDSAS